MDTSVKTKILLVDDEADILFVLEQGLIDFGYHVRVANSVDEALTVLSSWEPDFIVSDYSMPEKTGLDLLERVQLTLPNFIREGRFAILTGNVSFVEHHSHALEIPVLEKPVSFERLVTLFSSQSNPWKSTTSVQAQK